MGCGDRSGSSYILLEFYLNIYKPELTYSIPLECVLLQLFGNKNNPNAQCWLMSKGRGAPIEAVHPGMQRGLEWVYMQTHEPGDVSHLFPSRQKKCVCIKHFEQKFTQCKSLQQLTVPPA